MKKIAVIFGGQSTEHDVSIITAHIPIIQSLLASGQFDVWPKTERGIATRQ
jgi:D-alanine-D-alanine ligase-like ATP-grasp enzyme